MKRSLETGTTLLKEWLRNMYQRKMKRGKWGKMLRKIQLPRYIVSALREEALISSGTCSKHCFNFDPTTCTVSYENQILIQLSIEQLAEEPVALA